MAKVKPKAKEPVLEAPVLAKNEIIHNGTVYVVDEIHSYGLGFVDSAILAGILVSLYYSIATVAMGTMNWYMYICFVSIALVMASVIKTFGYHYSRADKGIMHGNLVPKVIADVDDQIVMF